MSVLRLRKVVRDLWATRTRTAMMVVAIAVSVVAVAAFLSARAILGREIGRNYLDTHPASATLEVPGGLDAATLAAVRAQPGVLDATTRTSLTARVRVGTGPPGRAGHPGPPQGRRRRRARPDGCPEADRRDRPADRRNACRAGTSGQRHPDPTAAAPSAPGADADRRVRTAGVRADRAAALVGTRRHHARRDAHRPGPPDRRDQDKRGPYRPGSAPVPVAGPRNHGGP